MGGASSSGSFLVNAQKRRDQLNKVRAGLLDRPGLPPKSKATPPPQAPAMGKRSPQQKSLQQQQTPAPAKAEQKPQEKSKQLAKGEEAPVTGALNLPDEVREEMLAEAEPFLREQRLKQRVSLHRTIGRARRFIGGGF